MSLLFYRHRLLSTGHHGNFPGNGPGPKPGKFGKMAKGPHGPPGGPEGVRMGPYRTVASPPGTVSFSPQTSTPIRTRELFLKTQTPLPTTSVDFRRKFDISQTLPRVVDLSVGCPQGHTDRSGWVRTHTGTRNCLPGQFQVFPFPFFCV